jgi:hypothetical protein
MGKQWERTLERLRWLEAAFGIRRPKAEGGKPAPDKRPKTSAGKGGGRG